MIATSAQPSCFTDLEVYQHTYGASIAVMTQVYPRLPDDERDDLKPRLGQACKAIPRLIAAGHAGRHWKSAFQRCLTDAAGQCNEMIVSLSHCRDLHDDRVDAKLCAALIEVYEASARHLAGLSDAWDEFYDTHVTR